MRYFLDTEFNGFGGKLISLALVREDGESAYYVLTPGGEEWATAAYTWGRQTGLDPWVKDNVLPHLYDYPAPGPRIMWELKQAAEDIALFLAGDPEPVIVTDWPADIRYFCGLIEYPGGHMAPIPRLAFRMVRVDAYEGEVLHGAVQHNAWWDSMQLRFKLTGRRPP